MVEIKVPALGESVTEATIAKWYKKVNDRVEVDELILELETEKVTLEVNAVSSGILAEILKNEGDTVNVGELVGKIQENGQAAATNATVTPVAAVASAPKLPESMSLAKSTATSVLAPSVQKLVTENNIDPTKVAGSGKDSRLTKGDVLTYIASPVVANSPIQNVSNIAATNEKPVQRVKMSRLRKTIAQRLKDSQNTAAILTTFNEIDMSNVIALRLKYREEFEKKHKVKLGFMSFFVKAVVEALKAIPSVNAEIDGEDIVYKNYYDIGVAVGTEQGLVVPIVQGAESMSFSEIEKQIGNLSTKARDGKLTMKDLTGGTFSISNGGVYGSLLSTPIINPPQSGILGIHKTQERPVVINGKIEIRPMMYVALSYDHRIIDGKEAVTFLIKVKDAIESPERLLLDI